MKRYYLLIILSSLIALLSCEKINYMYYLEKDSNMTFDLNGGKRCDNMRSQEDARSLRAGENRG